MIITGLMLYLGISLLLAMPFIYRYLKISALEISRNSAEMSVSGAVRTVMGHFLHRS